MKDNEEPLSWHDVNLGNGSYVGTPQPLPRKIFLRDEGGLLREVLVQHDDFYDKQLRSLLMRERLLENKIKELEVFIHNREISLLKLLREQGWINLEEGLCQNIVS